MACFVAQGADDDGRGVDLAGRLVTGLVAVAFADAQIAVLRTIDVRVALASIEFTVPIVCIGSFAGSKRAACIARVTRSTGEEVVEEFTVFAVIVGAGVAVIDRNGLTHAFSDTKLVFEARVILRACIAVVAAYLTDKSRVLARAVFRVAGPLGAGKVAGLLAAVFNVACGDAFAIGAAGFFRA